VPRAAARSAERGSTAWNPLLVYRREYFIQGPIRVLGYQSKESGGKCCS
jgi:hypothetical protein